MIGQTVRKSKGAWWRLLVGKDLDQDGCLGGAQLREGTPFGQAPHFLIRDRDRKYGAARGKVTIAKTLYRSENRCIMDPRFSAGIIYLMSDSLC
jgi:hypothetical protein